MIKFIISKLFFIFSLAALFIAVTAQNAATVNNDLPPIKPADTTNKPPSQNNKTSDLKKDNKENSKILVKSKTESLMFSDAELRDIERALDSYDNNKLFVASNVGFEEKKEFKPEENVKSYIYLNSILYFSPESWSVWINDKKISSSNNKHGAEFYIRSISGHEASILWTISISKWKILAGKKSEDNPPQTNKDNQVEVIFTLKPNQTFNLSNNKVVEGRIL